MKIALVRPNYKSHIITPPLGLGYLSSYLKMSGIKTKMIDGLRENLSLPEMVKKILEYRPDAVGITCLTSFYREVVSLSRELKKNKITTIIGGHHPTFLPYRTLIESQADYVVCGEGEVPLLKLVKNNFYNDRIQGVYSLDNLKSEKQKIVKASEVANLDDLPFPDWDQMNPNHYTKAPHGAVVRGFPVGVMVASRGCPYECTFCSVPKFCERKIRFRSPDNVLSEIEYLIRNFKIKEVHFEDDNFTLNTDNVKKLSHLLIERRIKINWACPNGVRADQVAPELVSLMRKSGCYYMAFGIESADPHILEKIKKRESIETMARAIDIAEDAGILTQGFFIFGLPGETTATMEENINFAITSGLSRAQFIILDVLPGSELWDTLQGKFTPNWGKESYYEPEWLPDGVSAVELVRTQTRAFKRFYFRPKILFQFIRLIDYRQIFYLLRRLKIYRMF